MVHDLESPRSWALVFEDLEVPGYGPFEDLEVPVMGLGYSTRSFERLKNQVLLPQTEIYGLKIEGVPFRYLCVS